MSDELLKKPGGEQPAEHRPTPETRKLVRDFYIAGVPQARLAMHLEITEMTLRKHYRDEMDLTLDSMNSKLATNLYQDAVAGDKQSREFWLKTRGRWSFARPPEDDKTSAAVTLLEKIIDKL